MESKLFGGAWDPIWLLSTYQESPTWKAVTRQFEFDHEWCYGLPKEHLKVITALFFDSKNGTLHSGGSSTLHSKHI